VGTIKYDRFHGADETENLAEKGEDGGSLLASYFM
jgi:hypothetical protein